MRGIIAALFALLASTSATAQQPAGLIDESKVEACYFAYHDSAEGSACIGDEANACQGIRTEAFDGATTAGITACLNAETAAWDVLLNRSYKAQMAAMKARDAENESSQIGRADALRQAQRAWIAFRDAECRRLYAEYQEGTIRSNVFAGCMMMMTADRTLALGGSIR